MTTSHRTPTQTPRRKVARLPAQALLLGAVACPTESSADVVAAMEPPSGAATTADASVQIAGSYRYAGGEKQRQQLFDAIEVVVAEMNFIARPIATTQRHAEGAGRIWT